MREFDRVIIVHSLVVRWWTGLTDFINPWMNRKALAIRMFWVAGRSSLGWGISWLIHWMIDLGLPCGLLGEFCITSAGDIRPMVCDGMFFPYQIFILYIKEWILLCFFFLAKLRYSISCKEKKRTKDVFLFLLFAADY